MLMDLQRIKTGRLRKGGPIAVAPAPGSIPVESEADFEALDAMEVDDGMDAEALDSPPVSVQPRADILGDLLKKRLQKGLFQRKEVEE